GEVVPVALALDQAPAAPPPPPAPPPVPPEGPADPGRGQRSAGYAILGVGAAGVVVGLGLGAAALAKKGSLSACGGGLSHCPPSTFADVDAYNGLRTPAAVAVWAGLGVAAAGVVVQITAPRRPTAGSLSVFTTGTGA